LRLDEEGNGRQGQSFRFLSYVNENFFFDRIGGISDTHYLFNGKVEKVTGKSVKRIRFWYLASVCNFTGEEKEQKDFWYFFF
jgi:hypothetical protein